MSNAQGDGPTLVHEATGEPVKIGDTVKSFRGDPATVTGMEPPHKPSASGRVYTSAGSFYVGVYSLKWINRTDQGE